MNKKDRIAIVVSIVYMFFPLILIAAKGMRSLPGALLVTLPVVIYWGYRFIKGDISFIGSNNDKS
ncbi:MAG: hypothetical protein M8364_21375 [Methylobacter sp.]|uniref:hypothetical protein n=1 Tax=Methylobacter sp. TaxID=2051955 RepID=UPI00258FCBCC|nr:hypothetical protein [Methylobacter sp.]MCL7423445.1 hypothetical protein [Methylobacter sp.]